MKASTWILGGALLLVSGGSAAIIIHQRGEIQALRARTAARPSLALPAPGPAPAPSPDSQPEPASVPAATPATVLSVVAPDAEVVQQRPGPGGRGAGRFAELLADPEIAQLMKDQQKAELDGRYAALFRKLGLSGPEIESLKELLAERQLARMEARAVARAEGLGGQDRDAMREIVTESDAEIEARISELIGASRLAELQRYERTSRERSRVGQLDQRLSYSQTPLQPYQSDALVEVFASVEEPGVRLRHAGEAAAYLGELEAYDAAVYRRAQAILSPDQLEALRQMQIERQNQARLGQLMRRRGGGG